MSDEGKKALTPEEFVLRAIDKLRDLTRSKGIHTVFSGFNQAFREYFPDLDPVEVTNRLAKEGKIAIRFVKGGALIYKAEEAPARTDARETLKKMGL